MIKSPKHQLQATCAGAHPEDHDAASPSRVRYIQTSTLSAPCGSGETLKLIKLGPSSRLGRTGQATRPGLCDKGTPTFSHGPSGKKLPEFHRSKGTRLKRLN